MDGLFRFQLKALCVACFGSRVRFVLGVLLAVFATAIDAWRFLRGVPRAFGRSLVLPGLVVRLHFAWPRRFVLHVGRGTGFPGLL